MWVPIKLKTMIKDGQELALHEKRPIAISLTDTHLNENNGDLVFSIFMQAIELALSLGVETIFHKGDVFDERKAQPQSVLTRFCEILGEIESNGLSLICIAGNHDKSNYSSKKSYLDPYKHWPNFVLVDDYGYIDIESIRFHLVPYFDENTTYNNYLDHAVKNISSAKVANILLTHVSVIGATDNKGKEAVGIPLSKFSEFDHVLIGHFHDRNHISNKVVYTGAGMQQKYKERHDDKGFVVFYDEGSFEFVSSRFPKKVTLELDVDACSSSDLLEQTQKWLSQQDGEGSKRIKLVGAKEVLTHIDRNEFAKLGVEVEKISTEQQKLVRAAEEGISVSIERDDLHELFEDFCDQLQLDVGEGSVFLNKHLKTKQ